MEIVNLSLSIFTAYTSEGNTSTIWSREFRVDPMPTEVNAAPIKDEDGLYINFSPVLKKWSLIVNTPVPGSKVSLSSGSKYLVKIGLLLVFISKEVLLILFPSSALYCVVKTDWVIVP